MLKERTTFDVVIIFICGLLLFTLMLAHQEIVGFESRFYLFALEMWRHGITLFPTTYNEPYPDYPVTATLFIYGFSKLMGELNKYTAVFPSALASVITLIMTYQIGALQSRRLGIAAVFFLLLTNTFVTEARTISPDQYVAMVTTICFYLIYSAEIKQQHQRLWWLLPLLIFGFACRGPIGLVIPAGVISIYYLLNQKWQQFFLWGFLAFVLLMLCSSLLFIMAYHAGGLSFLKDVLRMQIWGRMQHAYLPWHFYFSEGMGAYAITFPLAILIALGNFNKPNPFLNQLMGWVGILLVGLSIPAGKKMRYLLGMAPPLALMCGYLYILPIHASRYLLRLRQCVYWFCYLTPTFCFGLACLIAKVMPLTTLLFIFILLQILCFVVRFRVKTHDLWMLGLAVCSYLFAFIFMIEPMNLQINQTRETVSHIEKLRQNEHAKLVFYNQNPDGLPIKYLVNMTKEEKPLFMEHPHDMLTLQQPAFFVTDKATFLAIPRDKAKHLKIISLNHLGRVEALVFVVV